MSSRVVGVVLLAVSVLGGCDTGDYGSLMPSAIEVSSEPLAGTVGGVPWTYVDGASDPSQTAASAWATTLSGEPNSTCGAAAPLGSHLEVLVPKEAGDYPFSESVNGAFVVQADGGGAGARHVTFYGRILVESVTPSSVTARVHMMAGSDGSEEVNGRFTATICP